MTGNRRAAGLAWVVWALTMLGFAAVAWLDQLMSQAGALRVDRLYPGSTPLLVAAVGSATVGMVLAGRRPRHPVGWLLLLLGLLMVLDPVLSLYAVSYTHLTLPTNSRV